MAVAFWRRRRAATSQAAVPRLALLTPGAWDGWREFRVARREYEDRAQTLCSFHLEPVDGAPLPPFVPGQFLTFAVPISSDQTLTRCYSLSDGPHAGSYRISVKRVLAPAGRFVVAPEPSVPIVLIAGGIGITENSTNKRPFCCRRV
jgi:ferredoxin-NADP reductase